MLNSALGPFGQIVFANVIGKKIHGGLAVRFGNPV